MLGADLGVVSDDPVLLRRLERSLGAFVTRRPAGDALRFDLGGGAPCALAGDARIALDPSAMFDQAHALVFRSLLDRVDRYVVLHAAAVTRGATALLVGGPSGAGKTTLTLALLNRGFRLLSDDFSPLERTTGLIQPFPKALGIRPGPGAGLAAGLGPPAAETGSARVDARTRAAQASGSWAMGGKVL